ncbi:MAG: DUF308 domain-containing protein [Eggerthellaceae bacterium]|nr:DUF308 domain-containing protein [Eggerthellaceae bacterium]
MVSPYSGKNWQLIVAGILFVLFSAVCLFFPGLTLGSITFMIGAAFVLSGAVHIASYIRDRDVLDLSGLVLAYAILDVLIGLMFVVHPMVFAAVIPWVAGMFTIVFAIYELIGSFVSRKAGFSLWGWLLISGVLTLVMGMGFFLVPEMFAILIGLFALVRGVSLIVLGVNAPKFV